jgi:hypothetical protein
MHGWVDWQTCTDKRLQMFGYDLQFWTRRYTYRVFRDVLARFHHRVLQVIWRKECPIYYTSISPIKICSSTANCSCCILTEFLKQKSNRTPLMVPLTAMWCYKYLGFQKTVTRKCALNDASRRKTSEILTDHTGIVKDRTYIPGKKNGDISRARPSFV